MPWNLGNRSARAFWFHGPVMFIPVRMEWMIPRRDKPMRKKRQLTVLLSLLLGGALPLGCRQAPPPQEKVDKDAFLKVQMLGTWERQSDQGPVGYQREFKADGSVTVREFRQISSPPAPGGSPRKTTRAIFHRQYKADLPLHNEVSGTWTIKDGRLVRMMRLSNGDEVCIVSRIDRMTATEFVEVSEGIEGTVSHKYQRETTSTAKKAT